MHPLKAARLHEVAKRLWMQRPPMRQVSHVRLEESHPARRVDRLEDQRRARAHLVVRHVEKPRKIPRLEVFDHLNRDQPADALIATALQNRQGVALLGGKPARPTHLHHRGVHVHPPYNQPQR